MPRETIAHKKERALQIEMRMLEYYGEGECSLDYLTPFQLVIAVILSAQCTDAAVNKVTPTLFEQYPTPELLAGASLENVQNIIHSLGFYRNKSKHIIACAQTLLTEFDGVVPNNLEQLQKLPGVGRKTANVVMCEAFKNAQGIAVDTHVFRIAHRLGLATKADDTPTKVEAKLLKLYPQEYWNNINHQWVHFGREFCSARNPQCKSCILTPDLCPSHTKVQS